MQPMRKAATDDTRAQLFALIKARSFRRGKITLASGRASDFYFDMKPTMFDPAGAEWLAEMILRELTERDEQKHGAAEKDEGDHAAD